VLALLRACVVLGLAVALSVPAARGAAAPEPVTATNNNVPQDAAAAEGAHARACAAAAARHCCAPPARAPHALTPAAQAQAQAATTSMAGGDPWRGPWSCRAVLLMVC